IRQQNFFLRIVRKLHSPIDRRKMLHLGRFLANLFELISGNPELSCFRSRRYYRAAKQQITHVVRRHRIVEIGVEEHYRFAGSKLVNESLNAVFEIRWITPVLFLVLLLMNERQLEGPCEYRVWV